MLRHWPMVVLHMRPLPNIWSARSRCLPVPSPLCIPHIAARTITLLARLILCLVLVHPRPTVLSHPVLRWTSTTNAWSMSWSPPSQKPLVAPATLCTILTAMSTRIVSTPKALNQLLHRNLTKFIRTQITVRLLREAGRRVVLELQLIRMDQALPRSWTVSWLRFPSSAFATRITRAVTIISRKGKRPVPSSHLPPHTRRTQHLGRAIRLLTRCLVLFVRTWTTKA